jgi:flagellar hook-length control protein FliK
MADLPISISNAPAKAAAIKPADNDHAAQQDAQDFGDVLSRKFADTAKPATPNQASSANTGKQVADEEYADTVPVSETPPAMPADMLAALLAQQSTSFTPAPAIPDQANATNIDPDLNLHATTAAPGQAGKAEGSSLALINGLATANSAAPETVEISNEINTLHKYSPIVSETFKAAGMQENKLSANNKQPGANVISDPANVAQQPVILPAVAGAAPPSSPLSINTPVNLPAWGDEFGQKIMWMATQRNQSAELHLNPPQLGPLDVVLKMNGDQATAMFSSPHAAVREAIEQAIPKLREILADNGIMLGNAMVSDHSAKNNQDSSPRKSQGRSPASVSAISAEDAGIQEARVSRIRQHNGMVDTFA